MPALDIARLPAARRGRRGGLRMWWGAWGFWGLGPARRPAWWRCRAMRTRWSRAFARRRRGSARSGTRRSRRRRSRRLHLLRAAWVWGLVLFCSSSRATDRAVALRGRLGLCALRLLWVVPARARLLRELSEARGRVEKRHCNRNQETSAAVPSHRGKSRPRNTAQSARFRIRGEARDTARTN